MLIYSEECVDRSSALQREREVKSLTREQKLTLIGTLERK